MSGLSVSVESIRSITRIIRKKNFKTPTHVLGGMGTPIYWDAVCAVFRSYFCEGKNNCFLVYFFSC